jgi:hypothetical protein
MNSMPRTFYDGVAKNIRDDYSVLQAVLCDPAGRYPWDEGCRQEYRVAVLRSLS